MPTTIQDGTGSGHLTAVNSFNRIDASASVSSRIYYESRDRAKAFGITTPKLTLTTTGGRIIYLKNTSSSDNLIITDLRLNWNGGSSNHNRVVCCSIYFGDSAPTANNTTGAAGNLNRSSNNTFDIDVEYWDEVGDGMTINGGNAGLNFCGGQGSTYFPIQGAVILGANDTISFNLVAEEIGESSINILGFMEAK